MSNDSTPVTTIDSLRARHRRSEMEVDADSPTLCRCPVDARAHQRRRAELDYMPTRGYPRFAPRLEPLELVAERGCWTLVLDGPSGAWTYEHHPRFVPLAAPHELRHVLHPAVDAAMLDEILLNDLADEMAMATEYYDPSASHHGPFHPNSHYAWATVGEVLQGDGMVLDATLWRDGRDLSAVEVLQMAVEDDDLTPWSSTTSPKSRVFYSDLPTVGKAVLDEALALIGRARDELRAVVSRFERGELDESAAYERLEDPQSAVGALAWATGADPRDWYRRMSRESKALRKAGLPIG